MKIIFSEFAVKELKDSIDYYELEFHGLGQKFKDEILTAINRIKKFPQAWTKVTKEIRKYTLHNFPYNIFYSEEENYIFIIAIAHHHRKPEYWIK